MARSCRNSNQLCWKCIHTSSGCEWAEKLEPVPGWVAYETERKEGIGWHVVECPKYVPLDSIEREVANGEYCFDFRRWRRSRGLTLSQIAQMTKKSVPTVCSFEKSTSRRTDNIREYAKLLGVDPAEFFFNRHDGSLAERGVKLGL